MDTLDIFPSDSTAIRSRVVPVASARRASGGYMGAWQLTPSGKELSYDVSAGCPHALPNTHVNALNLASLLLKCIHSPSPRPELGTHVARVACRPPAIGVVGWSYLR